MTTGINESKSLTKHISCECKYKFGGTKFSSNQWWNNNKYQCECNIHHMCEKDYVWNSATCNCENGKCVTSILNDSVITSDEVINSYDEEIKTIPKNFNQKKITFKTQSFYVSVVFLLIAMTLLMSVRIYHYLMKYWRKHLLLFHNQFYIDSINWKWVLKIKP